MRSLPNRTEIGFANRSLPGFFGVGWGPISVAAATLVILATACTTAVAPPSPAAMAFPSPLDGPGRTQLSRQETDNISEGWIALSRGDTATAANRALRAGASPEAKLLELQVSLDDEPSPTVVQNLASLTQEHGRYAAAWVTLSVAAERVGDEPMALSSARKSTELWPSGPFSSRAETLEEFWITDRLQRAESDLGAGDFESALTELDSVLALEPDSERALLASARAYAGLDDTEQAESVLARLGDQPDALAMRAQIAYDNGQWNRSMDLLSRLPEGHPGRKEALRRARLRWRLSILPQYVQDAVRSTTLTREQLAVLLVALTPALETIPGGRTPLMPDVLNLPSQREILTVTRLGIMNPDPVDHRFNPGQAVGADQVRDAVEATSNLMGSRLPIWCSQDDPDRNGCTLLKEPLTGSSVIGVLLNNVVEDPEA